MRPNGLDNIPQVEYIPSMDSEAPHGMGCPVDDEFVAWFNGLAEAPQDEILAHIALLRERGPHLGRPYMQAIKKRAAELIAGKATLRQLREARERSQVEMAERPHIKQAAVSKLERRTDMYLSTLRSDIEAMGGKLEIIARFPTRAVRIGPFESLDSERRPQG